MNDPQIWTLIGVFAAIMLGGFTLSTTLILRTLSAKFDGVDARFDAVGTRFDAVERTMSARFETVHAKLDHLDRDVTAISKKVFGIPND